MAHELEATDRCLYAVDAPWHFTETSVDGRAKLLAQPFTLTDAIEKSSIGTHTTIGEELYVMRGEVLTRVPYQLLRDEQNIEHEYAVVSKDYALIQYNEMLMELAPLGELGWQIMAAGTLSSGGKAWISGRLPEGWSIIHRDGRNDRHYDWINAQFCHDTTHATSVFAGQFRIECANMLGAAQADEKVTGKRVKMVGDAQTRFGVAVNEIAQELKQLEERREVVQQLAQTAMTHSDASQLFAELLSEYAGTRDRRAAVESVFVRASETQRQSVIDELLAASSIAKVNEAREMRTSIGVGKGLDLPARTANLFASRHTRLMELFAKGDGNKGADSYDALNAVTQWVDHDGVAAFRGDAAQVNEKRFESAISGQGAEIKQRAFEMLVERVAA